MLYTHKAVGVNNQQFIPYIECYGDISCLHIPVDKAESFEQKDK